MEANQNKAWDILTDNEKNILYLQLSRGQSSWEAGEILNISHYKLLENKSRAEHFFKIFSNFFYNFPNLLRGDAPVDDRFRDLIYAMIEKRMTKKQAILHCGDSSLRLNRPYVKAITRGMKRLKESGNIWDKHLYELILEFDRWNNERILPTAMQQPSPFKRRNLRRNKTHMRYIYNLPTYVVKYCEHVFRYRPKKAYKKRYYIALFSEELYEEGYITMAIKADDNDLSELTKLYHYIFDSEDWADVYGYMVYQYNKGLIDSKKGLKFWPVYLENLERAINFKEVNNMTKSKMDMAYETLPKKPKKIKTGAKRAKSDIFITK